MKRICIIAFVVLFFLSACGIIKGGHSNGNNMQVSNDTTVTVRDTTTKVTNHNGKVKLKPKNTKPQVNTNDCKQCESQLAIVNEEKNALQGQVNALKTKLGNTKAIMDIDDRDFYRSLITTPLAKKYDSIQVEYFKETVSLFDHENKKEMKWVYEVYYPLLENYGKYNKDLAKLIQRVIKSFELIGIPDSKTEKELFNEGLVEMEYFKKYRYKRNISQEIKYLEDVIDEIKSLFDDPSKFNKESFENQLKRLGIENK